MKKIVIILVAVFVVTGCSSIEYHNGRNSLLMETIRIEPNPIEADIQVGEKISGTAECKMLFGFTIDSPQKQTYGSDLQVSAGNFSPRACTRGALYNALIKNNADLIIAPRYTAVQDAKLCIFGLCVFRNYQIIITGYKGTIKKISPMDNQIFTERQKQEINIKNSYSKK